MRSRELFRTFASPLFALALLLVPLSAFAAPEVHILRIDPRAGITEGKPELTVVAELVQFNSLNDAMQAEGCGQARGNAYLDCISRAVEKPNALYSNFPWPKDNARLGVSVDGTEMPARHVSAETWAASKSKPNIGTAWLIAVDASSAMGKRYEDARKIAYQFVQEVGPNDLIDLIVFDDRLGVYVADSKWQTAAAKAKVVEVLNSVKSARPSNGRSRPLFGQVKDMTSNAFRTLGNTGGPQAIPMHQAMVVISNGAAREDAGIGLSTEVMKQFFSNGRFPEGNDASPKTPLPVISIFLPNGGGLVNETYASTDMQFMQNLANVEIGGFFDIVREGQGEEKGDKIVKLVKARFDKMMVTKWSVSCLEPKLTQSFTLGFVGVKNVTPKPDSSFKNIPIGIDPTQWPLALDLERTKDAANRDPVYPGGPVRIFGDFCWGGDKQRAEAYFIPAGTRPDANINRGDVDAARRVVAQLTSENMKATAIESSSVMVSFKAPDEERILEGTGDAAVVRIVVYDNRSARVSGYEEKTILTLKAQKTPLNLPLILGAGGGGVVILLLLVVLVRGSGGKKKRGGGSPPPQQGGGGYGAPPYGGGPPGGYGGGAPPGGYGGGGNYSMGLSPGGGGGVVGASHAAQFDPTPHAPPAYELPPQIQMNTANRGLGAGVAAPMIPISPPPPPAPIEVAAIPLG